jgi:replicative DNA helicase
MNEVAQLRQEDQAPYIAEAEQAVLGQMLLSPELIGRTAAAGGKGLFYDGVHAAMFDAMRDRDLAGAFVSPVSMSEWARGCEGMEELGGQRYLARLAGAAPGKSSFDHYIGILSDMAAKRRILDATAEARAAVLRGERSAADIAAALEAEMLAAAPSQRAKPVSMMNAVTIAYEQTVAAHNGEDGQAVHSGIDALDRIVSGLFPGELILLGGRPSMGKTAVALSMGLNVARQGHGVVICSLEMNPEAMALRAISEQTVRQNMAVEYASMRRGSMSEGHIESFKQAVQEVAELPITFLPREFSDLGALRAGARQARRILGEENMRLLIVDYAQLLTTKANSRYEEITKISMALKALAGELNVPVLALSQLSRQLESREDKRPMMSDLRESGQLEQDADTVMFCYRDEYYLSREEPDGSNMERREAWEAAMNAAHNRMEIIVAKQRQGAIGTARVMCNPALNAIWE